MTWYTLTFVVAVLELAGMGALACGRVAPASPSQLPGIQLRVPTPYPLPSRELGQTEAPAWPLGLVP